MTGYTSTPWGNCYPPPSTPPGIDTRMTGQTAFTDSATASSPATASHCSWDCSKRFTLHPLADLLLYTSPSGRPVTLHFTLWQTCYFTLHPLADLLLYTSPSGRPVTLHFTLWQTCYFTLHPLADLLLYTSPSGRPVTLHFTLWQTCSVQHQFDLSVKHSCGQCAPFI